MTQGQDDYQAMSEPGAALRPPGRARAQSQPPRDGTLRGLFFGIVASGVFLGFLYGLEEVSRISLPLTDKFLHRGWTPYLATFLSAWAAAILFEKLVLVRRQRKILDQGFLLADTTLDDPHAVDALFRHIEATSKKVGDRLLGPRISRAIEHYLATRRLKDVDDFLRAENDTALEKLDDSYGPIRAFVWAIPILGFVGTVMGVGEAVGGFASFMQEAESIDTIKIALGSVTTGLSVAFDTTLIALTLSLAVMLFMSGVEKSEIGHLRQLDRYCQDNLLQRLPAERARSRSDIELLVGSLQHALLCGSASAPSAPGAPAPESGSLAEILKQQRDLLGEYTAALQRSGRDVQEILSERSRVESDLEAGPSAVKLSSVLSELQTVLGMLQPVLARLVTKPITVDVNLVAGRVSAPISGEGSGMPSGQMGPLPGGED